MFELKKFTKQSFSCGGVLFCLFLFKQAMQSLRMVCASDKRSCNVEYAMWSMQCAVCASHKRSIPFFFNTHLSQGSHARCQGVHYTAILWHDQKQGSKTLDGDEFKNKRAQSEFNSDCGSSGSPKYTSTVHPLTIP